MAPNAGSPWKKKRSGLARIPLVRFRSAVALLTDHPNPTGTP
jgi:hypothetical protein